MSTLTTGDSAPATAAPSVTSNALQERLAEAAFYAVLRRVAPVLRHDVAGFMQPVGMLTTVLQRRVQIPEPDLQAIAKNVASVSTLVKEATTGCLNAMAWMDWRADASLGLRPGVDEAIKLLAVELAGRGLQIVNNLPDDAAEVPQGYLRSVLMGALLAFCDQPAEGGTLQISFEAGSGNSSAASRLMLRRLPGGVASPTEPADMPGKYRSIDWQDVQAMAGFFGASMARGEDWLVLGLPMAG